MTARHIHKQMPVFDHYYLHRGDPAKDTVLPEPEDTRELRWQMLRSSLKRRLS